jgi:E3 ubiquitin-protein ligase NRDP1
MGLDENRFNSEVDEEFRCSICRDIIEDPIATQCEHVFCKLCINKWLQKDFSCPVDRKPLNNSQLCEPNRFFRNFYLKLELKCEFESNGCKKFCKIEDLFNHQKKCKYNPIVEYECEKECGALLTMKDEASHNCVQYLKNLNFVQKKELTKMCERETLNNELLIDMRSIVSAQYQEINGLKLKSDITNNLL